jgi:tetratricopeptide (TPR) repeat protein
VARDEGRAAAAADLAVAALSAAPQRLEAAPDPDSLRLAIEAIAADLFQAPDLAAARGFLARVLEIHPDDADWQNNLAFFCRELGVAAAETGDPAAAGWFEESWAHYSRAAELAPEDARILNDRALIAVYYLDEHWDFAERELHRAIEVGTRQLAEMPPDVPGSERRYVDEAVGDAWENLAYLRLVRRRQTEGVEDFLRRSSEHYPFERRAGVARLREALEAAAHHP